MAQPNSRPWLKWVLGILAGSILIPWMAWVSHTLIATSTDIAVIKGNRYTAADGLHQLQELRRHEQLDAHAGQAARAEAVQRQLDRIEAKLSGP